MNQKKNSLKFTGERLIPKLNQNTAFYYEHLNRYLLASQLARNKTVLDCACGTGYGAYIMAKHSKAKKVYGVDISTEAIEYAQKNYYHKNVDYLIGDAVSLHQIKSNSIELITSFETIEHLKQPKIAVKEFKRVIKSDGILIISTPNKDNYLEDNRFHVHEMSLPQFTDILLKHFKYVEILKQKYYLSQEISPVKSETYINFNKQKLTISNSNKYTVFDNPETKAEYYIAICSNSKLPKISPQQISVNIIDNLNMNSGVIPLEQKDQVLENKLSEITSSKLYKLWPIYNKIKNIFIK